MTITRNLKDKTFLGAVAVPDNFATMTPAEREAFAATVVEAMRSGMSKQKKPLDKETPTP